MLKLHIEDVHKSYKNTQVLNGVSFDVNEGEVIVMLGPSGCGKSTMLRCINGLERFQSGRITLDGESLGDKTDWRKVRKKVGMVFQSYDLFPHLSVEKNLLLAPLKTGVPKAKAKEDARVYLERVGLPDKLNSYPSELSGGQKQRVAICRALMMEPELMLFDEVTASLDPEMTREVTNVMRMLADKKMTMIIVTHEIGFAEAVADRVLFMDDGVILENTDPHTFFNNPATGRAQQFLNIFSYTI